MNKTREQDEQEQHRLECHTQDVIRNRYSELGRERNPNHDLIVLVLLPIDCQKKKIFWIK